MICPVCRTQLQNGVRYCPACNTDLAPYFYNQSQQQPALNPYQVRRRARPQAQPVVMLPQQPMQQNTVPQRVVLPRPQLVQQGNTVPQPVAVPEPSMQAQTFGTSQQAVIVCEHCGRPLRPGEVCPCRQAASANIPRMTSATLPRMAPLQQNKNGSSFFARLKQHMGIADRDNERQDVFESGKRIMPDAVQGAEGELPIRQYTLGRLRSRVLGVNLAEAACRMQITTHRVLFRAPGVSVSGRTAIQREADIREVTGMETENVRVFRSAQLPVMILLAAVLFLALQCLCSFLPATIAALVPAVLCLVTLVLFFALPRCWMLKSVLSLAVAVVSFVLSITLPGMTLLLLPGVIMLGIGLFCAGMELCRPTLSIRVLLRGGEALTIRPGHGYSELIPEEQVEHVIREAMAIIRDVQQMGPQAAHKWG